MISIYKGLSILAVAPAYNEEAKIGRVVERIPADVVDEVLVVDDGSTDGTASVAEAAGAKVLKMGEVKGVGAALRSAFNYAVESSFDVVVVLAGNNKDAPEEIPQLLDPIADGTSDFVQGSRYLGDETDFGDMPLYRKVATRIHPLLFSIVAGKKVTESTNGFRAIHTKIFSDTRIQLQSEWLDEYELEPYLYLKVIKLGYPTSEVPVTKVYPPRKIGQTKMKPVTGWWSILRPLVFVGLRIKK